LKSSQKKAAFLVLRHPLSVIGRMYLSISRAESTTIDFYIATNNIKAASQWPPMSSDRFGIAFWLQLDPQNHHEEPIFPPQQPPQAASSLAAPTALSQH
jgi:hypothetical protein